MRVSCPIPYKLQILPVLAGLAFFATTTIPVNAAALPTQPPVPSSPLNNILQTGTSAITKVIRTTNSAPLPVAAVPTLPPVISLPPLPPRPAHVPLPVVAPEAAPALPVSTPATPQTPAPTVLSKIPPPATAPGQTQNGVGVIGDSPPSVTKPSATPTPNIFYPAAATPLQNLFGFPNKDIMSALLFYVPLALLAGAVLWFLEVRFKNKRLAKDA